MSPSCQQSVVLFLSAVKDYNKKQNGRGRKRKRVVGGGGLRGWEASVLNDLSTGSLPLVSDVEAR